MEKDNAKAVSEDTVVVSVNQADPLTNTEPAYEEGPHLDDPDIRAAKRQQLIDAGFDHEDERLTPDMASILKEKG